MLQSFLLCNYVRANMSSVRTDRKKTNKKKKFDSASVLAQGRKCIVANCLDLVSAIGISISHIHV